MLSCSTHTVQYMNVRSAAHEIWNVLCAIDILLFVVRLCVKVHVIVPTRPTRFPHVFMPSSPRHYMTWMLNNSNGPDILRYSGISMKPQKTQNKAKRNKYGYEHMNMTDFHLVNTVAVCMRLILPSCTQHPVDEQAFTLGHDNIRAWLLRAQPSLA
jgi:hypothetical protein